MSKHDDAIWVFSGILTWKDSSPKPREIDVNNPAQKHIKDFIIVLVNLPDFIKSQ